MALCNYLPDMLCKFPAIDNSTMRVARKTIDDGFRDIVRNYGDAIDVVVHPLQLFLNSSERLFIQTPWIITMLVILAIVHLAGRSFKITGGTAISLLMIGAVGLWRDAMTTLSIVAIATLIAIVIGLPLGILMGRSERLQRLINPVLDVMQTLPSFVYLIPVVVIFGIGKVPGLIAVVIYAIPPVIRLTSLGIRLVDREVLEAADAFGSSKRQKLFKVAAAVGVAHHHDRHQPDHHDGARHGRRRVHGRCRRAGQERAAGHQQPVFHGGLPERFRSGRHRHHV